MDPLSPTGKLITTLKQQLKSKGFHNRDIASRLNVSEGTVKRYLRGKGVNIDVLQSIAEIVDLDLTSLVLLAEEQTAGAAELSERQKLAFKDNRVLHAVFYFLINGWTPNLIAKEFNLTDQVKVALVNLERLGLIRRLSANRIKIVAKHKFGEKFTGTMAEIAREAAYEFLSEIDLRSENCEWMLDSVRLSHESVVRLKDMIKRFVIEARKLTAETLSLSAQETEWYRIFASAELISRKDLVQWGGKMQGPSKRRPVGGRRLV